MIQPSHQHAIGYPVDRDGVRRPVNSGIAERVNRQASQHRCPFNVKFSSELREPAFAPREALGAKDAWALAQVAARRRPATHPA
jgi:hypothetical protein